MQSSPSHVGPFHVQGEGLSLYITFSERKKILFQGRRAALQILPDGYTLRFLTEH